MTIPARDAVVDTVTRVGWYADRREWERLPGLFADSVHLDYTSLTGGEPNDVTPAEIVESWRRTLGSLDATQHLFGSHLVTTEDDATGTATATATAQFIATHLRRTADGDRTWTLGGHYHWTLVRQGETWRITAMTMTATWSAGDPSVMSR